ncbi:hypothetical protein FRC17_010036 [Serendipita sp. 399]|nr:hypothetical protein FRC17_010036 [Serendipita sp. 399]
MDSNPWGNAWAEADKSPAQEVVVPPKSDKWVTSPVSGDLGASWTTGWGSQTETTGVWKSTKQTKEPEIPAWGTVDTARAAYVLGGEEIEPAVEEVSSRQSPEPVEEKVVTESESSIALKQILNASSLTPPDFGSIELPPRDDTDVQDEMPFVPSFTSPQEETTDTWRSLSNAAVTAGDEAGWEGAWKPTVEEIENERVDTPREEVDEWAQAIQEKTIRDARIPPEVLDMIMNRFNELSRELWPEEDLETAREAPAPRERWQGGLENVDGLASLINEYIPPPPSAPPIHFANTQIATAFNNALRMTKSYGIIQKSPLNRLLKAADSWEASQSHGARDKPFSLENWLAKQSITAPLKMYNDTTPFDTEGQKKTGGIKDIFSRGSVDLNRTTLSSSPIPRSSRDGNPVARPTSFISTSGTPPSLSPSISNAIPTEAPAPTSTTSAVTRFLNRFSRRTDDAPKRQPSVSLRPDELDFLDMVPTMTPGSTSAEAIRQEMQAAGVHPGANTITIGGMMGSAPSLSQRGPSNPTNPHIHPAASKDLINISSSDFDSLLDAQIAQAQADDLKQSLVDAYMLDVPSSDTPNSRYSRLNLPLFGSKPANPGAQLLSSQPDSNTSNTIFDDDDFDAFLSSPANQISAQQVRPTISSRPPSLSSSIIPPKPPTTTLIGSRIPPKGTSTPSRAPVVAIMSQSSPAGSRPGTPSNISIAPLLPPPPGGRPMPITKAAVDVFGDTSVASPPSRPMSNGAQITSGSADLAGLLDFTAPSKPSITTPNSLTTKPLIPPRAMSTQPTAGGLSAQDLSFFEGL